MIDAQLIRLMIWFMCDEMNAWKPELDDNDQELAQIDILLEQNTINLWGATASQRETLEHSRDKLIYDERQQSQCSIGDFKEYIAVLHTIIHLQQLARE